MFQKQSSHSGSSKHSGTRNQHFHQRKDTYNYSRRQSWLSSTMFGHQETDEKSEASQPRTSSVPPEDLEVLVLGEDEGENMELENGGNENEREHSSTIVEEETIEAEFEDQKEASLSGMMKGVVNKFTESFQTHSGDDDEDNVDGFRGKEKDQDQFLGFQSVSKLRTNFCEADIEMDDSVLRKDRIDTHSRNVNHGDHTGLFEMTNLEKEWEFIMCSNDIEKVKQFLDTYPFREEPYEKQRFVNYPSKINGFTALHYAAQFCNVNLVGELIKNRGVDASIQSNLGMTPLHVLAQARLDHRESVVKKITLARLLLLPSVKKTNVEEGEVLEPILASPYVRDHFGRKACDLLPPEHVSSMRLAFRGDVPDLPVHSRHKDRDINHPAQAGGKGQMISMPQKISFFDQVFGRNKHDDNRISVKHADPTNVLRRHQPSGNRSTSPSRKASTGILSAPRSLPVLNRSLSTRNSRYNKINQGYPPQTHRNSGPAATDSSPVTGKKKQADRIQSSSLSFNNTAAVAEQETIAEE